MRWDYETKNREIVEQKEKLSKTVVVLPFNQEDVFDQAVLKKRLERQIQKKIKRIDLSRIDEELNQIHN